MVFLYILLGILLFFSLIMFIPVKLGIQYKEKAELYLKILFVKIKLSPRKKKVNLKKYSHHAMEKARKKKIKQQIKKEKKLAKKNAARSKANTKEKKVSKLRDIFTHPTDIPAFLTDVYDIISTVTGKFSKRLKIKIVNFNVNLGSDNAAKTAILYGAVCAGINTLITVLVHHTRYNENDNDNISVIPDFTSEKTVCDIHLQISLRPGQVFTFLFSALPEIFRIVDYI